MRLPTLAALALAGATFAACADLEVTDPNRQTTGTFWQNQSDAIAGVNAAYNSLQYIGSYGRWIAFAYDGRSDAALSNSPWTDLANFNKFTLVSYDLPFNYDTWHDHYLTIFRANQVIDNVPTISGMDATLRNRIVGEARFIRAMMYFNLVNLWGNVPLILTSEDPATTTRTPNSTPAQVWAQIEADLRAARAVLPVEYTNATDIGRATRGAADALLGKSLLQQRKWNEASVALNSVITSGEYSLVPMSQWKDLFMPIGNNGPEGVFEVQMSTYDPDNGEVGLNIGKFCGPPQGQGPPGPGFGDCQPTRWYFNQFTDTTASGAVDPRRDLTIFHQGSSIQNVFGTPFSVRYAADLTQLYWKKWTMSDYRDFQDFDEPINYKVIRYADVLLMYAEARNELNDQPAAINALNLVRARAGVTPTTATTQQQVRDAILHERLVEFGLEQQRWLDMVRQGLIDTQAEVDAIEVAHDPEFTFFVVGKSERLPIPQQEINTNPNIKQNFGW